MIQTGLHQLIEEAHAIVEIGRDLDLTPLQRSFTIRANDALISALTAPLVTRMQVSAPGIPLRFVPEEEDQVPRKPRETPMVNLSPIAKSAGQARRARSARHPDQHFNGGGGLMLALTTTESVTVLIDSVLSLDDESAT